MKNKSMTSTNLVRWLSKTLLVTVLFSTFFGQMPVVKAAGAPPVAVNDTYFVDKNATLTVAAPQGVLKNDTDAENDTLTAVLVDSTSADGSGTFSMNTDGSFTFTPDTDFTGFVTFTYQADDGSSSSPSATTTIHVVDSGLNSAPFTPVAWADIFNTNSNTILNLDAQHGVLWNDTPNYNYTFRVAHVNGVAVDAGTPFDADIAHGHLTVTDTGAVTYGPASNYIGDDTFTYDAVDGAMNPTATVTVTIHVNNQIPAGGNDSYFVQYNGTLNQPAIGGLFSNDFDPEGQALTFMGGNNTAPAHGVLAILGDGSFTYSPTIGYNGPDSFTYKVTDSMGANSADIYVDLMVDVPPIPQNDSYTVYQDGVLTVGSLGGLLMNDMDPEADPMTVDLSSVVQPANGVVVMVADGTFTYTPNPGYHGTDSFSYAANDGHFTGPSANVNIDVVNQAPVAQNDSYNVAQNGTIHIDAAHGVLINDTDAEGDALDWDGADITFPTHGTFIAQAGGAFDYSPNAGYTGIDTLTYKAKDSNGNKSNVATVTINVDATPPTAVADTYNINESAAYNANAAAGVLANDSDVYGRPLTALAPTVLPTHGTLVLNADGSFTYTPVVGYVGADSFSYKAQAGGQDSNVVVVTINVAAVAPLALGDTYTTSRDTNLTTTLANSLLVNDSDIGGHALTASVVTNPSHGSVTVNANGTFTYIPAAGYVGADSFTYKVNDTYLDSLPATAAITVTIGAPVVTPGSLGSGTVGSVYSQSLAATLGSAPYTWTVSAGNLPTGLTLAANGLISGTPLAAGSFTFTVNATGSNSAVSAPVNFTIVINNPAVSNSGGGAGGNFGRAACSGAACSGTVTTVVQPEKKTEVVENFFTDTVGHWAKDYAEKLHSKYAVNGYLNPQGQPLHLYKPDLTISRAELITMVIKSKYGVLGKVTKSSFSDVSADHWAAPYLEKANSLGLITGFGSGTEKAFRPNQNATRAEALKMILLTWKTEKDVSGVVASAACKDVKAGEWYASYFGYAVNNKIVSGYLDKDGKSTGECLPEATVSRAEIAKILIEAAK